MVVTTADVCAVPGGYTASLAVGRSLWIDLPSGRLQSIRERVASGERAEQRGLLTMLKAPGTSCQLPGSMLAGLQWATDDQLDPEVDSHARTAHADPFVDSL